MFEHYFENLALEEGMSIREKWSWKYRYPLNYLNAQMDNAQNFVNTACSMLRECDLLIEHQNGAYRAKLEIPYGIGDDNEAWGFRTFGYIFNTDFLLDCTMVYDRMCETGKRIEYYKQKFFSRLFRAGILKHPSLHPLHYRWFKRHGDVLLQEDHKFYCVPNSVLHMEFMDFANIYSDIDD